MMELLSRFDSADPVSELLRPLRVRSTIWHRSVMRAPWGFGLFSKAFKRTFGIAPAAYRGQASRQPELEIASHRGRPS